MADVRLRGMPTGLDYPRVGLGAVLAGSARRFPHRAAFVEEDRTITFAELHDQARRVAQGLRTRGIQPGETVSLLLENSLWFPVCYYGALLAGAVVNPLNPAQPASTLREQLDEAGSVAVFSGAATLPVLAEAAAPGLRLILALPEARSGVEQPAAGVLGLEELLAVPAVDGATVERSGDDLAHLSFTGGTTGRSKAVRGLHRQIVANLLQGACWRAACLPEPDGQGGIALLPVPEAANPHAGAPGEGLSVSVAPMFHAMGLVSLSLGVLTGSTAVLAGRFDPRRYLDLVERYQADSVAGSPPMFRALLADPALGGRDLKAVRVVTSGAAPIDQVTLAGLRRVFPNACVIEGYGLTEATMALTLGPVGPTTGAPAPLGTVGLPLFDTRLQIRDVLDPQRVLGPDEIGEVWARGPQIADGYHNAPQLTAGQFVDGWLRTGDLGRLDADGYLFLEGRAKDMLIYKGYNVYPERLEELLCTHPAVAQASVVGVPAEGVGEIPVAYVVRRPGVAATEDELLAHVADRVVPYARVRGLRFVDALPVSAAGKILKNRLRADWYAD